MLGLFNSPKGQPYISGYRIDAVPQGLAWRGIVYDPRGVAMKVDFLATTKVAALLRARQTVDGCLPLPRRR